MSSAGQPLMVIGHKNPDTDSICSAIAYAKYKEQVHGVPAVPYRAGNLNPQTTFVLSHFGVQHPELLTTFRPKLSDIMIKGKDLLVLSEEDTLGMAQDIITQRRFAFLPVTGEGGKYAGKISALRLAGFAQDFLKLGGGDVVSLQLGRFIHSVSGSVVLGEVPASFNGRVWLPGFAEPLGKNASPGLVVLPNSHESGLIEAFDRGAMVVVVCGTSELDERTALMIRNRAGCVITTPKYALEVAGQICLSRPLRELIERTPPSFKPHDLVRDAQKDIRKYNEGGFVVLDDDGFIHGVITRVSFLTQWRFRVALVDHNEASQSIDGVEEANVEEVIDHHRLGYRSTDIPITFINKAVGCTSTIIAEMYRNSHQDPPSAIAGLMLAAIISDTLILKSPTTTDLDREMSEWLAPIAGVNVVNFGAGMLSAGCAEDGVDPRKIIHQDLKLYDEGGWRISVSQMETVGFDCFRRMHLDLASELSRARSDADCHLSCLMVTDVTSSTSLLLCVGEERIISAISYPRAGDNLFEMRGVLSRKKQMVPYLTDLIRRIADGALNS